MRDRSKKDKKDAKRARVLSQRRERRLADSQVDPEDSEAVKEMLELAEDEKITYEEE